MKRFSAIIEIIGANPFVSLPERVLAFVCKQAGRDKGPIRVRGTINGEPYRQTLLRYKGAWTIGSRLRGALMASGRSYRSRIQAGCEGPPC